MEIDFIVALYEHVSLYSSSITYAKIKIDFKLEQYLLHLPIQLRRNFTKLRISAHQLASEIGRYSKPKIPFEKRLCQFCLIFGLCGG